MLSLGEELPKEIARLLKVQEKYRAIPSGGGEVAVANIQQILNDAGTAILQGDIAAMLSCYKTIKRVTDAENGEGK